MQEVEQAPIGSLSCIVQRCASPAVLQAGIAASCQEQGRHKHRLAAAGHVQRCEAAVTLRIHVCTSLHCQQRHPGTSARQSARAHALRAHASAKRGSTKACMKILTCAFVLRASVTSTTLTVLKVTAGVKGMQCGHSQTPSQHPLVESWGVACLYQQGC